MLSPFIIFAVFSVSRCHYNLQISYCSYRTSVC